MKSVAILLFAVTCLGSTAFADGNDDRLAAAAKAHYEQGQTLYTAGQFAEARAEFLAGFELSHKPAFLFNAAECARLLGNTSVARDGYDQYLKLDPNGKLAMLAMQRLAERSHHIGSGRAIEADCACAGRTDPTAGTAARTGADDHAGRPTADTRTRAGHDVCDHRARDRSLDRVERVAHRADRALHRRRSRGHRRRARVDGRDLRLPLVDAVEPGLGRVRERLRVERCLRQGRQRAYRRDRSMGPLRCRRGRRARGWRLVLARCARGDAGRHRADREWSGRHVDWPLLSQCRGIDARTARVGRCARVVPAWRAAAHAYCIVSTS